MPFAVSQRSKPSTLTTMDSTTIMARLVAIRSRTRFMGIYSPLRRSNGGRLYGIQDGARALLGDHIGRRVGIPGRDAGEYRSIDHAQAPDAMHAQRIIDYCHGIAAHLAGSHRMEDRGAKLARGLGELFIRIV